MRERPKSFQSGLNLSTDDSVRRADGECSPSWLAMLRCTSDDHLPVCPPHEESVALRLLLKPSVGIQAAAGYLHPGQISAAFQACFRGL